jgi:DNA-binding beta-propeller fold protein YncE
MRKLGIALPAMLAFSVLLGSPASANIPVGAATHAVAINHTTGLAYVGAECVCGGSLVVIDTATDTVVTTITTVSTPTQIAVDEERNRIFAAHFTGGGVSVIDGTTNTVITVLTPGGLGLAVDPVRDRLYATLGPAGMAVYDLNTLELIPPIVTHSVNWWGVAVNPVTDRIYVAILEGAVSVLDGETFTDQVPAIPIGLGEGRFGITVDIAQNLVYVPRFASVGRILVINGATNLITRVEAAGSFPAALALDAAHGRLYSADISSGTVTVLSTQGPLTRLSTIAVGGRPNGVAVPTLGPSRVYVTNSLTADVTVVPITFNAPPVMVSATIAPTSPDTDDVLTATGVAQDPDGDQLTYSFQWIKAGLDIPGATGATLDLGVGGNGDHGDQIAVRVTASDGSATSGPLTSAVVTVVNSAPEMTSATITPASPDTDDVLTATPAAQDLDSDPLTFSYQWTKGGIDITGATGATLDLGVGGNGDHGDQIAVRVTASDGSATSVPLTSAAVTVVNSAPSASVTLTPIKPAHKDLLTADVAVSDADLDTVTLTYVWRVQGEVRRTFTTTATTDTFDLSLPHNGSPHDMITVTVTPNDGFTDGAAATATAFVVPGN